MFVGLLLVSATLAGEPGYYHLDLVGGHSQVFVDASAKVAKRFQVVEGQMAKASPELVQLDLALALCAKRAPQDFVDYATALRRDSSHQTAVVQAFVDTLVADFELTFTGAMERVLDEATAGYDVSLCKGSGIHALMGRTQCQGEDLAPRIGEHMDRDENLRENVQEILSLEWPAFLIEGRSQNVVPITGVGRYVRLDVLVDVLVSEQVNAIQARSAAALEEVEPDLEEGETRAIREHALVRAQDIRAIYEGEMVILGEQLFSAVAASLTRQARRGAPSAVGVCPNPTGLGGCTGDDVTDVVMPLLEADKKLAKALAP